MFYMAFPYIYIYVHPIVPGVFTPTFLNGSSDIGSTAPRKVQCLQYATVNPHSPASRSVPCCAEVPKPKDWLIDRWVLKWISLCVGFFFGLFFKGKSWWSWFEHVFLGVSRGFSLRMSLSRNWAKHNWSGGEQDDCPSERSISTNKVSSGKHTKSYWTWPLK